MNKKVLSKINVIVSVLLCLSILFGGVPAYAAGGTQTDAINDNAEVNFIFVNFRSSPDFSFSSIQKQLWYKDDVKVLGYSGFFTYVQILETEDKGYIFSSFLKDNPKGTINIEKEYVEVNAGSIKYSLIDTNYNGSENITWTFDKEGVVKITKNDDNTLNVQGLSPGVVTVTVAAGISSDTCRINCVYKWKKEWTTKTNTATKIYTGPGTGYGVKKSLSSGKTFVVKGDEGGSEGWAYGCHEDANDKQFWGYVRIEDVSTKGTVSQYNSMNWRWPLKNLEYNYINSPYGTRKTSPTKHKGIDISTNWDADQPSIEGQTIVSAFRGMVDYVCVDSSLSWGYCVSIISDEEIKDPASKKQFVGIYMHMENKPKVSRGKEVSRETELGYVGNTGNSTGAHLHFEVNNQTASIYESNGKEASDAGRSSYNDLINPIFFYMSFSPQYNKESQAEKFYNGTFWYGSE